MWTRCGHDSLHARPGPLRRDGRQGTALSFGAVTGTAVGLVDGVTAGVTAGVVTAATALAATVAAVRLKVTDPTR